MQPQELPMPRQSISLTEPNAEWVKSQIESKEYTSMSDAVNDLIRQARRQENDQLGKIRSMLIEAEKKSGAARPQPEVPRRHMGFSKTKVYR